MDAQLLFWKPWGHEASFLKINSGISRISAAFPGIHNGSLVAACWWHVIHPCHCSFFELRGRGVVSEPRKFCGWDMNVSKCKQRSSWTWIVPQSPREGFSALQDLWKVAAMTHLQNRRLAGGHRAPISGLHGDNLKSATGQIVLIFFIFILMATREWIWGETSVLIWVSSIYLSPASCLLTCLFSFEYGVKASLDISGIVWSVPPPPFRHLCYLTWNFIWGSKDTFTLFIWSFNLLIFTPQISVLITLTAFSHIRKPFTVFIWE